MEFPACSQNLACAIVCYSYMLVIASYKGFAGYNSFLFIWVAAFL